MARHRTPLPLEIKELISLIRWGHLFEVQKWIQQEKPIRLAKDGSFITSPLAAAIRTGFHSMVEVLLDALGKEVDLDDLLHAVVRLNRLDLIELLHRYGANPKSVSYDCISSSHDPALLRWFEDQGVDLETNYPLAHAFQLRCRAALGTYMRWKDRMPQLKNQANMALRFHAAEGNLKWVCLLLWAGADPRARVPNLDSRFGMDDEGTALEAAIFYGHFEVVKKLKIDPIKDDTNELLYESAFSGNKEIVELLLELGADPTRRGQNSPVDICIWSLARALDSSFPYRRDHRTITEILCLLASKGARWNPLERFAISGLRRALAKADPSAAIETLVQLVKSGVFTEAVFTNLVSTPRMKELLKTQRPGVVMLRDFAGLEVKGKRMKPQFRRV